LCSSAIASHHAERAALRWLGRWCLGAPDATPGDCFEATVGLSAVEQEPEHSEAVLRRLAARLAGGRSGQRMDTDG
jgi:hypothetical protein